jgi:hypothetical protein
MQGSENPQTGASDSTKETLAEETQTSPAPAESSGTITSEERFLLLIFKI